MLLMLTDKSFQTKYKYVYIFKLKHFETLLINSVNKLLNKFHIK